MDFFEHLRGIDFCTFLDFPTTCTVRNRPRVKILEDGRVSLYGELRKRAAEQQRDYCARISPDGRCIALYPERTPNIHFHMDGSSMRHESLLQGSAGTGNCCDPSKCEKSRRKEKAMKRRFSCREISLIDQMIQTIGRDLFLPERLGDDARSIGWCTFLHTYQKYPAQFLWAGVGGWARAYLDIQTELRAFQVQETSRYYTPSVDQPLTTESKAPLLSVFRAKHADFRSYICLRDYMQRLPEDEKWLAGTLSSGYTLEEIPVLFCCTKEELTQIHNRLQRSMMEYLKI